MGAVAAAALVGGGAALAGSQLGSDEDQQAILDDAAEQLGVEPSELRAALVDAYEARIDAAVTAGDLSQEQADALKERLEADGAPLFGPLFHGPGHHHGFVHFGGLEAAATYLGLTDDELRERLESGDTLAEIASAEGKTVDGLVQAMADAAQEDIAAAVEAGRLTQEQADEILADLPERLEDLVNGELPGPGGPPGHRWSAGPEQAASDAAA
jgi:polyhydroxyalkanoate synthesis regulator phasin